MRYKDTEDMASKINEPEKPQPETEKQEPFEKQLTKKYHFKSMKDNGQIYYYDSDSGIFRKDAEWLIEEEWVKYHPDQRTTNVIDVKNRIIWANYTDRSEFDPDINWLCCANVMVNIRTGEVKEHGAQFMATVRIPHIVLHRTPHVPLPYKILKFLHEVMAPDDVETVLDFIAYCLWRDFPFHKWLLFNGSGRNGKGVTTNLITAFLGRENISNETLERLLENNFSTASLFGKMANIDADVSSEELKRTGILKNLTGGDRIVAEFKFRQAFSFKNYAKLIFSANKIPATPDDSDAYFSRPLIINFPNQFLGDKAKQNLIDELTTEEEMSAFLSLILKRLPRVLQKGITSSSTIEQNYVKYIQSSDPIALFIERAINRVDVSDNKRLTKEQVYQAYDHFCADKKLARESSDTFSRRLKVEGFLDDRKRIDGMRRYVWVNIELKDYRQAEEGQETL